MGIPPASPPRITQSPEYVNAPPPPPTFRGRFQEIEAETAGNSTARKKALWEHCMAVVAFLRDDLVERHVRLQLGAAAATDPDLLALSRAETALAFNLSGITGYDPSRDYEGPAARAFDYVRNGAADAFVDRVLRLYHHPVTPMPDPRVDPQDFADWSAYHGGRRRRTRRRRVRAKRTYRHSVRRRQG
jgi:hypothetical protein